MNQLNKFRLFLEKNKIVMIIIVITFIIMIFQHYSNDNLQKFIKKEVNSLKDEQKILIENEKKNLLKINDLNLKIDSIKETRNKLVERYYHTKEIINNKIKEDEKNIDYSNISIDTLQNFLSKYKHNPYKRTSN